MNEYVMRLRPAFMPFLMIAALMGLVLVSYCIFYPLAVYTLPLFFGVKDGAAFMTDVIVQVQNPLALLYVEMLVSSIGTFFFPAVFFHVIFKYDMRGEPALKKLPSARQWFLAVGIMLAAILFTQLLVQINSAIPLSEHWKFLRTDQQNSDKIINSFFSDLGMGRFGLLVFGLGILPAMAEELFFRGTIQNLLMKTYLGPIWAVVMAGALFSLIHLEFDNFIAIWCMGIVLGLLYYYTGSIWVSVGFHFLNNFLMILGKFAYMKGMLHDDMANNDTLPIYVTLPAGILMVYGLVVLKRWKTEGP